MSAADQCVGDLTLRQARFARASRLVTRRAGCLSGPSARWRIEPLDPSQIFRQVALDRLVSPERLDTLLGFPFPRLWLMLLGVGALAVALALWWLVGSGGSLRALVVG
jgi:hypothetical protein